MTSTVIDVIDLTLDSSPPQSRAAEVITISDSEVNQPPSHSSPKGQTRHVQHPYTLVQKSKPVNGFASGVPISGPREKLANNSGDSNEEQDRPPRKRKRKNEIELGSDAELHRDRHENPRRHQSPGPLGEFRRILSKKPAAKAPSPNPFFYLDAKPDKLAEPLSGGLVLAPPKSEDTLVLPEHVSLHTSTISCATLTAPVEIPTPNSPQSTTSSFIEYLDDLGAPRYYEKDAQTRTISGKICRTCGEEGHIAKNCDVMLCLTCGIKGEHNTRSCPVSIVCFGCGRKGHLARACPTPHERRGARNDCYRCGSSIHNSTNCPTLWRIYTYVSASARDEILLERERKKNLGFAGDDEQSVGGGEGYISRSFWCYNCGGSGHLGDDCQDRVFVHDKPAEPSAFGTYNTFSGPFASDHRPEEPRKVEDDFDIHAYYRSRRWENETTFDDGYGFTGESAVGKRGKEKQRKRGREMERAAAVDNEDDWFSNPKRKDVESSNSRNRDIHSNNRNHSYHSRGSEPRRIEIKHSRHHFDEREPPTRPSAPGLRIKGVANVRSRVDTSLPYPSEPKGHRQGYEWETEASASRSKRAREGAYGSGHYHRASDGARQQYKGGYRR